MQIIGCDLHSRRQTLAMLDTATGEVVEPKSSVLNVRSVTQPRFARAVTAGTAIISISVPVLSELSTAGRRRMMALLVLRTSAGTMLGVSHIRSMALRWLPPYLSR